MKTAAPRSHVAGRFRVRVRSWARRIAVRPDTVEFGRLRAKWASCSADRRLLFTEELLDEPAEFQNFVIVHELLHLRVRNHGPLFRMLLTVYQPNWREVSAGRVSRQCSRRGPV